MKMQIDTAEKNISDKYVIHIIYSCLPTTSNKRYSSLSGFSYYSRIKSNRNSAHFVISLMIFCSLKLFTRDRNMQAQVTREFKHTSNFMNYHITTEEVAHMLKISKALCFLVSPKMYPERVTKKNVACSLSANFRSFLFL